MSNEFIFIVFGTASIYFGISGSKIFPTLLKLLAALYTGTVKWPGPGILPIGSRMGRRSLAGYDGIFSTFIFNTLGVIAAFVFSMSMCLSQAPFMSGYIRISWTWLTIFLILFAFVGGIMADRKAQRYKIQVNTILLGNVNKKKLRTRYPLVIPTDITSPKMESANRKAYQSLLCKTLGDKELVERLVKYEYSLNPKVSLRELMDSAVIRWEQDNR